MFDSYLKMSIKDSERQKMDKKSLKATGNWKSKQLSYCLETTRRECLPNIVEMTFNVLQGH